MDNGISNQEARNNFIDLLKLVCAVFVIITHISWSDSERSCFVFPFIIDMAVPMFLIISAFLRTKKIQSVGFKKYICFKYMAVSFIHLFIAYIIVFAIELAISGLLQSRNSGLEFYYFKSVGGLINWFYTGLSGPGSYYVPVMVQLIVYFPILFLLFRKDRNMGIAACFIINLIYEIAVYIFNLSPDTYRLLVFRYTLITGFGIYLATTRNNKKDDYAAIAFLVIGLAYIIINSYIWPFPLFQAWKSTSMLCAPYVYAIAYFLFKRFQNIEYKRCLIFGKASYHIYLTQMVYYAFVAYSFKKIIAYLTLELQFVL